MHFINKYLFYYIIYPRSTQHCSEFEEEPGEEGEGMYIYVCTTIPILLMSRVIAIDPGITADEDGWQALKICGNPNSLSSCAK